MSFLIVLASAFALRLPNSLALLHRDSWLEVLQERLFQTGIPSKYVAAACIALPALVISLLFGVLSSSWLGLFEFFLALFLVLYSLGRNDFDQSLTRYRQALTHDDSQAAWRVLEDWCVEPVDAQDLASVHANFEQQLLGDRLQQWFTVIFWFLLAGPLAAFIYRLLQLSARDEQWARQLLNVLDYPVVIGLGMGFFLLGRLDALLANWQPRRALGASSSLILHDYLLASDTEGLQEEGAITSKSALERLDRIEKLLERSLLLWVVVSALIALSL